jgi:hypothetical protein
MWGVFLTSALQDYNGKVLNPNHPISRRVHKVAASILEANDLGTLRSSLPETKASMRSILFGTERGSDGNPAGLKTEMSKREWNLLVVHDPNMVNAMAVPGIQHPIVLLSPL